jgi:3-oxoacyl-[acyl-carrier-protein] synthase-3
MIVTGEVVLESVFAAPGDVCEDNAGRVSPEAVSATGFPVRRVSSVPLFELAMKSVDALLADASAKKLAIGGVVAATYSQERRFPPLAVRIASAAGLSSDIPAVDLQMACSAYPYAIYTAGALAAGLGKPVLAVDGDVQSRLVGADDAANAMVMGDAASATLVLPSGRKDAHSCFEFMSQYDEALSCGESGPVFMDGFKVFAFVASKVKPMLERFISGCGAFDRFVPHQANMYMLRRLAKGLGVEDKMLASGERFGNVGSASVPLTIADEAERTDMSGFALLLAGFGAGFSAAAAKVGLSGSFTGKLIV